MGDRWIGLCEQGSRSDLRRALSSIDPKATLEFADSAKDLRERVQGVPYGVGALVGPLVEGVSPLNLAAAMVRDGMARDVVLVTGELTEEFELRAKRAGVQTIVDLSTLPRSVMLDLDEPDMLADEVPTIVYGAWHQPSARARVPAVEEDAHETRLPASRQEADLLTLPLVREGAHGPEVEQVSIPRDQLRPVSSNEEEHAATSMRGEDAVGSAPILTFVSGRGGVGKTALVAMMATVARRWDLDVALCDLDLTCGNLYSCFATGAIADLSGLASCEVVADADVQACGRRLSERLTLWGPCERPEMAEVVSGKVGDLLRALSKSHDLVLVDTSTTFTDAVAQAAQLSDRLVITVDGRPGSVAAQSRLAALAVRLGVARTRMARLANRCGPNGRGEPLINRADVGLETIRPLRVLDGGAEVSDCMAEGKPDDLVDLGSRFAESAASVLAHMLSELGALPAHPEAERYLKRREERSRWSFGRKREAM